MKELTDTEIQWLEAFAKKHEFFASFLLHYNLKHHLSNNQYYWLHLYINQAEEQGDTILSAEEIKFMKELLNINSDLTYSVGDKKRWNFFMSEEIIQLFKNAINYVMTNLILNDFISHKRNAFQKVCKI